METLEQVKLYILSLMFLFIIILLMALKMPVCDENLGCCEFQLYDYLKSNWLACLMLLSIFICLIIKRDFEFDLEGGASDSLMIKKCQSENYEHLTFLSTYIIPFLGFNFDSPMRLLAYLFLVVLIGVMLVRSDKCYANPTLAVLGYKLYRATLSDGCNDYNSVVIVTKSDLSSGDNVAYKFISKTVCFVRKVNSVK